MFRRVIYSLFILCIAAAPVQADSRYDVTVVEDYSFSPDGLGRIIPLRLSYPMTEQDDVPVIVFSHGAYAEKAAYGGFADAWAAHGYAVIVPTHPDSEAMGTPRFSDISEKWPMRYEDVSLIADHLDDLVPVMPGLGGVDKTRLVIAGHSAGGLVALGIGGAALINPDGVADRSLKDDRYSHAIVISGPGKIPGRITEDTFAAVDIPMLVITGTADVARGDTMNTWEWRRAPYDYASPGSKHLLVIEDGDHYLGGAMGRFDLGTEPDLEGLALANAATTTFLAAYVRSDSEALGRLTAGEIGDLDLSRAEIKHK